jgi:2-keto-3-deoxy-L-rhamnonate aldolase RhmA
MGGIYNEAIMPRYIGMGARFVLGGQDATFMMAAAQERSGFLRRKL